MRHAPGEGWPGKFPARDLIPDERGEDKEHNGTEMGALTRAGEDTHP